MNQIRKDRTTDLVNAAVGAVLIIICSWISIPAAVPFTLQTFAVFCVLELLGGTQGTMSIIVYMLLGLFGLPVFSGFRGGLGTLLGPTGGYIIGFFLTGLLYQLICKMFGRKLFVRVAACVAGLASCYLFGTLWFVVVYTKDTAAISFGSALMMCVVPFIIPDLIKLALAISVAAKVRQRLGIMGGSDEDGSYR